jgi:hypothetical protein
MLVLILAILCFRQCVDAIPVPRARTSGLSSAPSSKVNAPNPKTKSVDTSTGKKKGRDGDNVAGMSVKKPRLAAMDHNSKEFKMRAAEIPSAPPVSKLERLNSQDSITIAKAPPTAGMNAGSGMSGMEKFMMGSQFAQAGAGIASTGVGMQQQHAQAQIQKQQQQQQQKAMQMEQCAMTGQGCPSGPGSMGAGTGSVPPMPLTGNQMPHTQDGYQNGVSMANSAGLLGSTMPMMPQAGQPLNQQQGPYPQQNFNQNSNIQGSTQQQGNYFQQ